MSTVPLLPIVHDTRWRRRSLVPPLIGALVAVAGCASSTRAPSEADDAIDLTGPEREPTLAAPLCYETSDAPAGCTDPTARPAPAVPAEVDETVWKAAVDVRDPLRGPEHAPVTIVVFSDFECPYCRRAAQVIERVREAHPETLRIVWKDFPLPTHDRAEPAALFARAIRAQQGDAGFWKAHDALFERQPALSDADFDEIAKDLGADFSAATAAMASRTHAAPIVLGRHLGERLEVDRTPTLFVNGRKIPGAPSVATLEALVQEEHDKAKALLDDGVPPAELYRRIIEGGKEQAGATDLP